MITIDGVSTKDWLVNVTFPGGKGITLRITSDSLVGGQLEISPAKGTGLATDEKPGALLIDVA